MKRIEELLGGLFATNDFKMALRKRIIQVYTTLQLIETETAKKLCKYQADYFPSKRTV